MRVLLSGSTGLIGGELLWRLKAEGHHVTRLVRSPAPFPEPVVVWDYRNGPFDPAELSPIDAVIHLAGENISTGSWTAARKERIRSSRVVPTRLLAEAIARAPQPPAVFIVASAVGYYGDRGDELLSENSAPGTDFLAQVVQDWEAAAKPAAEAGVRVVHTRFGVVLSPRGGALAKMLPLFRAGVGGRLGSGNQFMSWVALEDATAAIVHALTTATLRGPVNVVAPNPVTNREFTKALGAALGRPTFFAVPRFALRLVYGEMADATLLSSTRVSAEKLVSSGFVFRHPALETVLKVLG